MPELSTILTPEQRAKLNRLKTEADECQEREQAIVDRMSRANYLLRPAPGRKPCREALHVSWVPLAVRVPTVGDVGYLYQAVDMDERANLVMPYWYAENTAGELLTIDVPFTRQTEGRTVSFHLALDAVLRSANL